MALTRFDLCKALLAVLIQARKDAGLTQVDLAARIGQRQTFISKFVVGERRLDAAEYIAIARAVGAEPYDLIRKAERL